MIVKGSCSVSKPTRMGDQWYEGRGFDVSDPLFIELFCF